MAVCFHMVEAGIRKRIALVKSRMNESLQLIEQLANLFLNEIRFTYKKKIVFVSFGAAVE